MIDLENLPQVEETADGEYLRVVCSTDGWVQYWKGGSIEKVKNFARAYVAIYLRMKAERDAQDAQRHREIQKIEDFLKDNSEWSFYDVAARLHDRGFRMEEL